MGYARRVALPAVTTMVLFSAGVPAHADLSGGAQARSLGPGLAADVSGGAQAPSAPLAGGSEYAVKAQFVTAQRPVVRELLVPNTAPAGRAPRVQLRIDESGVRTVQVQVTVIDLSAHRPVITVSMGWVHTGRILTVAWPRSATLKPGSYQVNLSAHDHSGGTLLRRARSSGEVGLTVKAPPRAPAKTPPVSASPPGPSPEAGVPTPAQSVADRAVFPVTAAHSFGGPENRFGAPRGSGRVHQGQDVLTAEGSPVVVPMAGTVLTTSYQAGGAGYYAVVHTDVGFDFMFAHCQAESLAVSPGQAVSAGQALCRAGQTGDATAPHLHFEMWVGGWQVVAGHPIDPLPYLEAWDNTIGAGQG
jgi:murein DD-endopeptidase MepM/ murein hydrolase activator NlpD